MNKINLQEEFVKALIEKIPQRPKLTDTISNILGIEKEPAGRRLNGRVQFSIYEMGLLAKELDIYIDPILHKDLNYECMPLILKSPSEIKSIESLWDVIESGLAEMREIIQEPVKYNCVFNSLPLEFFVDYSYLMKFMFFKWGSRFIGSDEFNDFGHWVIPSKLTKLKDKLKSIISTFDSALYIWDNSLIWNLVEELDYLHKMQIINAEDLSNIKNDLKDLLIQLEKYLQGTSSFDMLPNNLQLYISNVEIGVYCLYLFSEKKQYSTFSDHFIFPLPNNNNEGKIKIKKWINSLKKISVLISGCGGPERCLFFKKQHEIIDKS